MKFGATILFIALWLGLVIFLASGNNNGPDLSDENIERNRVSENPCEFMSSGQYSVNC